MIRPIGPRVLLRPIPAEPDPSRLVVELEAEPTTVGEVLSVGDGGRCPDCGSRVPMAIEVGSRVALKPTAIYQAVTLDGEELWIVLADDVIGELEPLEVTE